jgi:amino acid adenylation domain-containing protein
MLLTNTVIADPESDSWSSQRINDYEQHLLDDFNNTVVPYPKEKTIIGLFEEQVLKTPGAIALRRDDEVMNYRALNKYANKLARYLVDNGVKSMDNVAILTARRFDMIIGMLAIMKAGAAYVPIDPDYPLDRQEYILQNSAVKLVLADSDYPLTGLLPESQVVKLREININKYSHDNLELKVDSRQLAYTIYTSGSTGRPKGVMIEHHSAVNLIQWVNTKFSVGPDDCLLFVTSMCFDLSVYDIFGLLAAGGSIVMVEKQELMDVPKLKEMLLKHKVTFWDSVPSTIDYFVGELEAADSKPFPSDLRLVFMSGDWIPVNLPDRIKKYFPQAKTISLGGATEGTVWSNYYPIDTVDANWASIPYGKPIDNNFFYILDEELSPVPLGETGELYIGGVGVARGYANDKEKTDKAFIKDPFNNRLGGMMYKTGDLGRMLLTMDMEFIGRIDDQVKIRGFRIELGEITTALQKHKKIKNAVVLAKTIKNHEKELVAYIVGDAAATELKTYLHDILPFYMVPGNYIKLDAIPLTSNGKVDKNALLLYAGAEADQVSFYAAPRTNIEKLLTDIWAEALGIKKIGIYDNFFEIGGHSLIAVKVMTKIERVTGKRLPLASLFEKPTIEKMALLVDIDGQSITWDSLVLIKPQGNKMPLYIVHGAGLNVLLFNAVAMGLSPDQPVYGLQAKGLNGVDEPFCKIEDMAAHYIEAIMRQNPDGPYALAGFSFGGIIAWEMARQLEVLGKEVKMLAVFDTYAYKTSFYDPAPVKIMKKAGFYLNSILHTLKFTTGFKSTITDKSILLKRKLLRYYWKIAPGNNQNKTGFFGYAYKIDKCNFDALKRYRFKPHNIEVNVFRAETRTFYVEDKKYMGWKPYALKGVNIHKIPGEHNTIFKAPNDKIFADVLQKCLNKAVVNDAPAEVKKEKFGVKERWATLYQ